MLFNKKIFLSFFIYSALLQASQLDESINIVMKKVMTHNNIADMSSLIDDFIENFNQKKYGNFLPDSITETPKFIIDIRNNLFIFRRKDLYKGRGIAIYIEDLPTILSSKNWQDFYLNYQNNKILTYKDLNGIPGLNADIIAGSIGHVFSHKDKNGVIFAIQRSDERLLNLIDDDRKILEEKFSLYSLSFTKPYVEFDYSSAKLADILKNILAQAFFEVGVLWNDDPEKIKYQEKIQSFLDTVKNEEDNEDALNLSRLSTQMDLTDLDEETLKALLFSMRCNKTN